MSTHGHPNDRISNLMEQIKLAPPDQFSNVRILAGLKEIAALCGLNDVRIRTVEDFPGLPTFKKWPKVYAYEREVRAWVASLEVVHGKPQPPQNMLRGYRSISVYLSRMLPLTADQVMGLCNKGELPTFKIGRHICAQQAALDQWATEQLDRHQRRKVVA